MLLRYVRQGKEKFILFQSDFVGERASWKGDSQPSCTGGTSTVMCKSRSGAACAWERANRSVGMLPMRNGSRHEAAPQDEVANACIYNIYHTAPVDESPRFAGTFCGIVSHAL